MVLFDYLITYLLFRLISCVVACLIVDLNSISDSAIAWGFPVRLCCVI